MVFQKEASCILCEVRTGSLYIMYIRALVTVYMFKCVYLTKHHSTGHVTGHSSRQRVHSPRRLCSGQTRYVIRYSHGPPGGDGGIRRRYGQTDCQLQSELDLGLIFIGLQSFGPGRYARVWAGDAVRSISIHLKAT
jgi:hypothetical protein